MQLISIVGKSKSGKTTLLEKLLPELKKLGYRVGVMKHSSHGFDLDREGKDSHRMLRAGGEVVAMVAPHQFALIKETQGELTLGEALRLIADSFDLLIVEGYSRERTTKIETHLSALGNDLITRPSELWAVVSDASLNLPVPCFPWQDISGLVNLIARTFPLGRENDVDLFVNGTLVKTNAFVNEIMGKTLLAMTSTLKGIGEIKEIDVRVRWRQ